MTKKQRELIGYIEKFIVKKNYNPSYTELSKLLGKSKSTLWELIERAGYNYSSYKGLNKLK